MAMARELVPFLFTPPTEGLIFVTAADSSHYLSLGHFLTSLWQHDDPTAVVVFDLGLRTEEHDLLSRHFPRAQLRLFDYSSYPDYFNIKVQAGQYAWKPVILAGVAEEFRASVCWMDAGNVVTSRLVWLRKILRSIGLYSPASKGRIRDWTHPKTLEYLGAGPDLLDRRNLNGACVAVDYRSIPAMKVLKRWKECALIRECIAPHGSDRNNHRQDQSVLSVLCHQMGLAERMPTYPHGFRTHGDIQSDPPRLPLPGS
jgi:hypothetical protein